MSTVRIVLAYNQESFLAKRSESEWIERDPLFGAIRFKTFNKIVAREAQPIYSFLEEVTSQPAIDQTSGEEIGWAICVHIANFPATNEHIQQIFTTNNVQLDTDDSNHPQLLRDHVGTILLRHFQVLDRNSLGEVTLETVRVYRTGRSRELFAFPYPRIYAFVAAIDDYSSLAGAGISNRPSAIRSAQTFAHYLKNEVYASVREIYGNQATSANINQGIGEYLSPAQPSDLAIFYFGGRAATRETEGLKQEGHLLPADTHLLPGNTQVIGTSSSINWLTCLSVDKLVQLLSTEIQAHHIFLILDVAVSGVTGILREDLPLPDIRLYMRRTQKLFIAARNGEDLHDGGDPEQLSMFTSHILQLLRDTERLSQLQSPIASSGQTSYSTSIIPSTKVMDQIVNDVARDTIQKQHPYSLHINRRSPQGGGDILLFVGSKPPELIPIGKDKPLSVLIGSKPNDPSAQRSEEPQTKVEVRPFLISRTPITMEQYWVFIRQTNYHVPFGEEPWAEPYNWNEESRTPPLQYLDYPVVNIAEEDTFAYCQWLEKQWSEWLAPGQHVRLPTEAEWELAVRGSDGNIWPWGNTWESGRCNSVEAALGGPSSVYRFPPQNSSGLLDAVGNVWQRCCSFYSQFPFKYEEHLAPQRRRDKQLVIKGGAWNLNRSYVRCATRAQHDPSDEFRYIGFRIVIGLPPEFSLVLNEQLGA